jgi:tRNA modification GTPase
MIIDGVAFRFIDTAGIRETKDVVESIGIQKTFEKITQAQVVLYLMDVAKSKTESQNFKIEIETLKNKYPQKLLIVIGNKADKISTEEMTLLKGQIPELIPISAKEKSGIETLTNQLTSLLNTGALHNNETIVTNSRHYDALLKALNEIKKVDEGIQMGLSSDLMAIDIREALYYFGLITGEVTNDDLLGNIFANFCIGK